ncbi:MAG: putative phosphoesterase [Thermoleophilia bacterium]|nr:putative phosphoesterase [Thermoleophilia bacterium]MCZ4496786.1 putative phosphoesterase [Thermoleophilia bacterium]
MHLLRSFYQRRSSLVIRTRHVDLRPRGLRLGLRIVLASDIHARDDWFPRQSVEQLVRTINDVDGADLVALVGDFVGNDVDAIDWSAELLGAITAPTFATLGNHDHWTDARRIERTLEAAGIPVLTNRAVPVGTGSFVAGIDSCWTRRTSGPGPMPDLAFADVTPGSDVIVLGHEPHLATLHEHALHLAGHTHLGQVRTPVFGDWTARMHMPRFSEPYPCRLYELPVEQDPTAAHRTSLDRRWVYTTAGVGYSTADFRLFCPPEIVVIDT